MESPLLQNHLASYSFWYLVGEKNLSGHCCLSSFQYKQHLNKEPLLAKKIFFTKGDSIVTSVSV